MSATTALRREHDHILSMIACLRAACAAAKTTGILGKENGILFNMADQMLTPETQAAAGLGTNFTCG